MSPQYEEKVREVIALKGGLGSSHPEIAEGGGRLTDDHVADRIHGSLELAAVVRELVIQVGIDGIDQLSADTSISREDLLTLAEAVGAVALEGQSVDGKRHLPDAVGDVSDETTSLDLPQER